MPSLRVERPSRKGAQNEGHNDEVGSKGLSLRQSAIAGRKVEVDSIQYFTCQRAEEGWRRVTAAGQMVAMAITRYIGWMKKEEVAWVR